MRVRRCPLSSEVQMGKAAPPERIVEETLMKGA
jgi:hypothetical protein